MHLWIFWRYLQRAILKRNAHDRIIEGSLYPTISDWDLTQRANIQRSAGSVFTGINSTVYCGKMRIDGKQKLKIAIKELRLLGSTVPPLDTNRTLQRFYMEVLIWSRLRHPNVAEFHGFTIPANLDEPPTILSRWYQNGGLGEYLKRDASPNRLSLLGDVASAVQYLHSLDIVHGDIKLDNVLVDDLGRGRLCDFGASHFINNLPVDVPASIRFSSDHLRYTLRFASPELLLEGASTKMSDMWALGCTAMQILTDQVPYGWLRDIRPAQQITYDNPFSAYQIVPRNDLERGFIRFISTCWSSPLARPSAAGFLNEIEALINQG